MKKTNFLFSMVAAIVLLWGMSAYAQTNVNVSSAADLRAAVTTLSSTGGTITLVPPFTGNPTISGVTFAANALGIGGASTSQIVLSANAPITIDCGTNKITVYTTDNVSVAVGTLVIGNNITVTGTGAVTVDNLNRGILEVKDGGVVENRAASGGVANNAPNGRSVLSAGSTIATYSPNGAALKPSNSMTTIVQGGTLIAEATGAVALNLSGTPGTNYPISNTTIKATGSGAI